MKMHQATISIQPGLFLVKPGLYPSYIHINAIGWKQRKVPKSAPIRETRELKTGIAEAMM